MATGLSNQAAAAVDTAFVAKVTAAIEQTAINVFSEATTLAANLPAGFTVTTVPISFPLGSNMPAGTVVSVGGEMVVISTNSFEGAINLAINPFTPARSHVSGEPVSPPTVSNHAARSAFANQVLRNPTGFAVLFAWTLAGQGIDASSSDSDIVNGTSAVWNQLANA